MPAFIASLSLYVSLVFWKHCFLKIIYQLWLLSSWVLSFEGSIKVSHLGLCTSNLPLSANCPMVDLHLNYYLLKEVTSPRKDTLVYGQSNMSLGVVLFLCSFNRVIVSFPLGPITYLVSSSWPQQQCLLWRKLDTHFCESDLLFPQVIWIRYFSLQSLSHNY